MTGAARDRELSRSSIRAGALQRLPVVHGQSSKPVVYWRSYQCNTGEDSSWGRLRA
jgi:hypothetical protein